jgi:arginyl-tRNA synthetase
MLGNLNKHLENIFKKLNYDIKFATFRYSDRPDLSDFQTNASMPLAKILSKNPKEIGESIVSELKNIECFEKVSIDGPGFINVSVKDDFLIRNIKELKPFNKTNKKILIEYFSPNVAKEAHVGHLKNAILGSSLVAIYKFAGDSVITDNHWGDWGTNMGMVIEAIKTKYPDIKCFQKDFNEDSITDINLSVKDLCDLYRFANITAKEDKEFYGRVLENTNLLQQKYKPYYVLWQFFYEITLNSMKKTCEILNISFDTEYGESFYDDLCNKIVKELKENGKAVISEGALIVDIRDLDMPPFLLAKSNGSILYATTDLAAVKYRVDNYNPDEVFYIVDYRQSLHFKQVFATAKRVGYLPDKNHFEHIGYGTINGKDGKPYKTRSGDVVNLSDLIDETTEAVEKKATIKDKDTIKKIAIACLKFADLINYRESSYVFDMEQFTNFEGKTGAYILYSIVRINSILEKVKLADKIEVIKTKEERELLFDFSRFNEVLKLSYEKKAPHFIAEYVYNIAKKFNTFYGNTSILNETDEIYKKSKIALIILVKKYLETCLNLLNIEKVEKM